jgi:hypothetical protein
VKRIVTVLALTFATCAWASDPFQTPTLASGSAYISENPSYRVLGVETSKDLHRFWVVAEPSTVLRQASVNKIITDIRRRAEPSLVAGEWQITFYRSALDKPSYPSFKLGDEIANYSSSRNKTYFVSGAKTYGGWAVGPAFGNK